MHEEVDNDAHNMLPIRELGKELSVVLSVAVTTSGYDEAKIQKIHKQLLKGYTDEKHPICMITEPEFNQKLDKALDALVQQPATQRKALLEHIQEIAEHDNIVLPEEKRAYEYIVKRLNPPAKAA